MGPLITDDYASKTYYFQNFESKEDFSQKGEEAYVDEIALKPTGQTAREYIARDIDSDFIGSSNRSELDEGKFLSYIEQDKLDTAIQSFEELFATIDMGGAFNKAKLIITDDKRGIFDFGLASKGLYRLPEYFSQELADESPLEFPDQYPGVVPADFVDKDVFENFWYTSIITQKKYQLTQRQKGLTEQLYKDPSIELIQMGTLITSKLPIQGLEFATTVKKSYVMFEKKGGKSKMVDLYVVVGGLADLKAEGMLARTLPLLLAARYFELAGIRTRINAVRAFEENGRNLILFTYPIKDYGDDIDYTYLAVNTADPRWFRWNMWKYTSAIINNKLDGNSIGWGSTLYSGDKLYETFNRYKNWYSDQMSRGLQPELSINPNLMLIGGLPSPNNSIERQKDAIVDEFFRIVDIVDFQFNKPEKAAQRIYKREVEDKGLSVSNFKSYVLSILARAYSYPQRGSYATPSERQDILEEEYDVASAGLTAFLETIK